MIIKLLKLTFWSWWDNISYSIITSFMGATNPFFLIILATFMYFFSGNYEFFIKHKQIIFLILFSSLACVLCFPTTIAAFSLQERILTNTYSSYFIEYWKEFIRLFFKSLMLTLINLISSLLLGYSIIFYVNFFSTIYPFNWIFIGVSIWLYLLLIISQIFLIPMIYKEKENIFLNYLVSVYMSFKFGLYAIIIFIINIIAFFIFCIPVVNKWTALIPMISFFGFISTLNIQFYRIINEEVSDNELTRKRKITELFTPFLNILKKNNKRGNKT